MSECRDSRDYLVAMRDAAESALEFTRDMTYEEFCRDRKTLYAVVTALEILGEAAKHVDDCVRRKFPAVPWKLIAGLRDALVHGIAAEMVWSTVQDEVPQVQRDLAPVLEELVDKKG